MKYTMKYLLPVFLCFLLVTCKDKKTEPVKIEVSDTTEEAVSSKMSKMAAPLVQQQPFITEGKDTVLITTIDTTVTTSQTVAITTTYPITKVIVKPYKSVVTPPPPPPTGTVKYLTLPKAATTSYSGKSNFTIDGVMFPKTTAQNGNSLVLSGCSNVVIKNCYFPSSIGCAAYVLDGSNNIRFENCLFAYNRCAVIGSLSSGIFLFNCEQINGYGSGMGDGRDGGILKLIQCKGAGFGVVNCRVQHFPGESNPEDIVSLFASEGTATSPIQITGNTFVGGGPSKSGGGIVAGDGTASITGGFVNILNNTLLDPGNYGIAVAGGHDIRIEGNKIYARQQPFSNNGLFIWNQYAPTCANITVRNNRCNWTCGNPANCTVGQQNHSWNGGGCGNVIFDKATTITLAEMAVPAHLFQFLTPSELLAVRAAK